MRTKHNCEVFVAKEFAWLPRYFTKTISFVTACSAAHIEIYFIGLEYPNVKTCLTKCNALHFLN